MFGTGATNKKTRQTKVSSSEAESEEEAAAAQASAAPVDFASELAKKIGGGPSQGLSMYKLPMMCGKLFSEQQLVILNSSWTYLLLQ